ncbi:hypothetical protein SAMN04489844_0640 [Nocardioides exalbidus]|uniref:Uncharacterized protein n=1 Tax=Nocardioides exalbidus TaxID=402596 RepID=A0A1H4KN56_9ACTN|nr:hypothetical protein [Nocardioides exalbidus]SEB59907.1 hypothetical protein SAMN04489844_0640 [Nocardioides exalbidus]
MSAFDIGCQVGAKASELIDGTPPGYTVIGGKYGDIGPSFGHYDGLPGDSITGSWPSFATALNSVAIAGQGSSGVIADAVTVTPNGVFANMERIATDVDDWKGSAATDFTENYKAQLPYVADANFTGISVAIAALEAQNELYTTAYESIIDIGNKTLSALEAADGRGGADGSFALTVLAAVGTVAVTVASAGTAAVVIAVAAGAASVGASATSLDFSAGDPEGVMTQFYDAVDKVENHVKTRQQEISQGLRDYAAAVNADINRTDFAEGEFPAFKFKPTGFAQGPGNLGGYDG